VTSVTYFKTVIFIVGNKYCGARKGFLMYISFSLATLSKKPVLHQWLSGIYLL
jgi:hypothetical protein